MSTISSKLPIPNPFDEAAEESSLEAELRDLAARNSGVQLTETYQVHADTPALLSLAAPTGSQDQEEQLACIGMSVRVTRMLAATGVPAGEVSTVDGKGTTTQTVTTHREARGMKSMSSTTLHAENHLSQLDQWKRMICTRSTRTLPRTYYETVERRPLPNW